MATLSGVHVIITRPSLQAKAWADQLASLGATSIVSPVLEIRALENDADKQHIKNTILNIDQYQKIIFVSQNAVSAGFEWMDTYWPQFPMGLQYFAVGAATARLAREKGFDVTAADVAMNSEELLALADLNQVAQQKVLIMRGAGGRTHLREELEKRRAMVDYCELYERALPKSAIDDMRQSLAPITQENLVLTAHSGESLENLDEVLKCLQQPLYDRPLLIPGTRVANLARELGYSQLIVALNATDAAMTQALVDWHQASAG